MESENKITKLSSRILVNAVITAVLVVICLASAGGAVSVASVGNNAVYRGNPEKAEVTLMFNVYWGSEYIPEILKTLGAYDVKTTFFVGGSWVAKNPQLLKDIVECGHEVGSHGYNHRDSDKISYKQNVDEIVMTHKLVKEIAGVEPNLYAPPSGAIGKDMFRAAADNGYTVIMWSRDTIDWRDKNADLVYKRATEGIRNGELILMHPTAHTLEALPAILKFYKEKGLTVVPVSVNVSPTVA